jgi:hypothetical protein
MKTCSGCRFWRPIKKQNRLHQTWGECDRALDISDPDFEIDKVADWSADNNKILFADREGFAAHCFFAWDFGCNQWQRRTGFEPLAIASKIYGEATESFLAALKKRLSSFGRG